MPLNGVVYIRDVSGNTASLTNSGEVKIAGSISATSNISGQVVLISGQPVTANVTTNISGQVVRISGETVTVSNDLTTAVSGETIYLVNDGVNNVVQISGQTVVANVTTNISGQAVRITDTSGNNIDTILISGVNRVQAIISGQIITAVLSNPNGNLVRISGAIISGQVVVAHMTDNDDIPINIIETTILDNELESLNALVTAGFNYAYDDSQGRWARLRTTNSGDGFKLAVSISGQPVTASVTTDISGQTVYLVDNGVNNVVKISGQTVEANVNVETNISGQTVYFVDNGVNNVVKISGQTVVANVQTDISGQAVRTSGQTVYFVDDSINNKVKISGQTVNTRLVDGTTPSNVASVFANTEDSSQDDSVAVLGTAAFLYGYDTPNAQWERTQVNTLSKKLLVTASGDTYSVSGIVAVNSLPVISVSGNAVRTSGQTVYFIDDSINNKVKISGQLVAVSGIVTVNSLPAISISGNAVRISGQTVYFVDDSVNNKVKISGQLVAVSGTINVGNTVTITPTAGSLFVSGEIVRISGQLVSVSGVVNIGNTVPVTTSVSGNIVRISGSMVIVSGQPVRLSIPTDISVRPVAVCTAASGGTQLLSGDCRKATFINAGNSGQNIWLGSTTEPPFSGKGFYLLPGNGITLEINNFNVMRACSVISGAWLSYGGERF